jgi:hypothetical protein
MTLKKKEEGVVLPRRYEVYGVPLPGRSSRSSRARFHDFAEELEFVLNDVSSRDAHVLQVQFLEGHGAVVVVDTQRAMVLGALPEELLRYASSVAGEEVTSLDGKMQEVLGLFLQRAQGQQLSQDSPEALRLLKEVFRSGFRGLEGPRLQELLANMATFIEKHEKACADGSSCKTLRLLRLAERALSENMKESLQ